MTQTTEIEDVVTESADHIAPPDFLAHHFETPQQQFDAGKLGMWIFLATEVLFFSGLFVAYAVYRSNHPEVFVYAHQFLDKTLGTLNTIVLLFSSLTMAWAVRCAQLDQQRGLIICLILTLACAGFFLGVKAIEYSHKWDEGLLWAGAFDPKLHESIDHRSTEHGNDKESVPSDAGIFFSIYYAMTGVHAIHIVAGMGAIAWLLRNAILGRYNSAYFGPVDYVGLYWHLVDLIWIFLFPLLYLIH